MRLPTNVCTGNGEIVRPVSRMMREGRALLEAFDGWRRRRMSPFSGMNMKVFLVPAIIMAVGAAIWLGAAILTPENYWAILLGEILVAIGLFVFILLGFWLMTLIRIPK